MKNIKRLFTAIVAVSLLFVQSVFAEKTPIENLYEYTLDNGLTVFIAENHTVPLAYIEIAVKAGAITQTPENAGLFHLYEHMMFKGNALYPNAAAVNRALSDIGVAEWNGTTSSDHVNYFFTIPSDQLEKGLAFWNAAIRSPLMDEREFENEKKVVLAEIEGDSSDPQSWMYDYFMTKMFPDEPYRLDAGGSFPVVKNATIAQMRDMQSKYYIPKNAALFIGGDVNPEETLELVNKIYGSWSNNGNERPSNGKQQNTEPFDEIQIAVLPYDKVSSEIVNVEVVFRGPDADFNLEDTYAADYLCQLLADPDGAFLQTLVNTKELQIPDVDYVSGGYGTSRAAGEIYFESVMLNPEEDLANRVLLLEKITREKILPNIAKDKKNFSKKKIEAIARSLSDDDIKIAQTATGLLNTLRFWWCATSADYYYSYNDKISSVTSLDMQNFVAKYIEGKKPLIIISLNPEVYAKVKDSLFAIGAEEITYVKTCKSVVLTGGKNTLHNRVTWFADEDVRLSSLTDSVHIQPIDMRDTNLNYNVVFDHTLKVGEEIEFSVKAKLTNRNRHFANFFSTAIIVPIELLSVHLNLEDTSVSKVYTQKLCSSPMNVRTEQPKPYIFHSPFHWHIRNPELNFEYKIFW